MPAWAGAMTLREDLARTAVQTVADALDVPLEKAAEGIIRIVNENMCGALRLVSVEQGYDPREFALIGFGGAGPLHANAIARLINAWPVIIPPGPGVLCAYGDVTTRLRNEASQTYVTRLAQTDDDDILKRLDALAEQAAEALSSEGVTREQQQVAYEIDIRYVGQGMKLTIGAEPEQLRRDGLAGITGRFDQRHEQLFTFALDAEHELVGLRAVVQGAERRFLHAGHTEHPDETAETATAARVGATRLFVDDAWQEATIYDRAGLRFGNELPGPAIVTEMDSTTLILPAHTAYVDAIGNLVIRPSRSDPEGA